MNLSEITAQEYLDLKKETARKINNHEIPELTINNGSGIIHYTFNDHYLVERTGEQVYPKFIKVYFDGMIEVTDTE